MIRLEDFERRKTEQAVSAKLEAFRTLEDRHAAFELDRLAPPFAVRLFDGAFFQSPLPPAGPLVNLVFVQSKDGNTGAEDPATLGGGEMDKHIIYEGLSRVDADAVLAGSTTAAGAGMFSVWHPEMVRLRAHRSKPRHPAQIVLTSKGQLPIETGLMFNVPDMRVFILASGGAAGALVERARSRSWITVLGSRSAELGPRLAALRRDHGIDRISAIGGRRTATSLLGERLVTDLYLTTSARNGGEPGTPFYEGTAPLQTRLVVRKAGTGDDTGVTFEHRVVTPAR